MKIAINALSARLGGGQTYLINLLAHLPSDFNFEILIFSDDSLTLPVDSRVSRYVPRWPTVNPLLRAIWEKFLLPQILIKEKVDVLFCPGGVVSTQVPQGCKVVTMFRNMIPFDERVRKSLPSLSQKMRNMILSRVMLKSMAKADLTIFISNYARSIIQKRISVKKAVTIPHGISQVFNTVINRTARSALAPAGKYLLYVSRFDVYKHHYEVVTAFSLLSKKIRDSHTLVLAGETNLAEFARVKRLIDQLELSGNIQVLGPVPYLELPSLYAYSELNIFASSCENCPNILLESMAAGRPVVCSDVMPMPEFGGDSVAYFSPFDPLSICAELEKVLKNAELSARLASSASVQSSQYNWQQAAAQTWNEIFALEKVVSSKI